MTNKHMDGLKPDFAERLTALLDDCAESRIIMVPYFGLRDPVTQGRLWRRSRTKQIITNMIESLDRAGAPFLSACLVAAGPANGSWATNAVPGNSWHQWGEAMDCYWLRNGSACWDTEVDGMLNGYNVYMAKAAKHDLTAIGLTMGKDFGHVQKRSEGAPHDVMALADIDAEMRDRFPGILGATTGD